MDTSKQTVEINFYKSLYFISATSWLVKLLEIEKDISIIISDENILRLRTNSLKAWRETRDAALLCHGISARYGYEIGICKSDDLPQNHTADSIACWIDDGYINYGRIQLKEVPPSDRNRTSTLDDILNKLPGKYQNDIVGVKINRMIKDFDIQNILTPKGLVMDQLWLYGAISENRKQWFLYGDLLKDPKISIFTYPE